MIQPALEILIEPYCDNIGHVLQCNTRLRWARAPLPRSLLPEGSPFPFPPSPFPFPLISRSPRPRGRLQVVDQEVDPQLRSVPAGIAAHAMAVAGIVHESEILPGLDQGVDQLL